jgi:hypothetical protein
MMELSLFLALLLFSAATHKLVERERLAASAAVLSGTSAALGPVISLGAAALEAMAGLALLFPASRAVGALIAGGLWAAYGMALVTRYGSPLDCGCSFASREKPVDAFAVSRAFGLALLALTVFLFPAQPFSFLSIFAASGFFALYLALGELTAITISKPRGVA